MDNQLVPTRRPLLFFKRECPPCAFISRLVGLLSLGAIGRVALESAQARAFYQRFPHLEGMPLLIEGERVAAGRAVFSAIPGVVARYWWAAVRQATNAAGKGGAP